MIEPCNIILAKSRKNGGTSLLDHTNHVVDSIIFMAQSLGFGNPDLLKSAAVLHDLGKAHPKFRKQLQEAEGERAYTSSMDREDWAFTHRHELSSLLFLPCFPKHYWNDIIEMVVSHHKSMYREDDDKKGRGILDLVNRDGFDKTLRNHLRNWEDWSFFAIDILNDLGYKVEPFSKQEAEEAWEYALDYCEARKKDREWSVLRGLLMAADHFASSQVYRTNASLANLFQAPNLDVFEPSIPGGVLYPLTDLPTTDLRKHTLLVAPTGAGKTNFLMRRCEGRRVFYTLPFQASINAMWKRFNDMLPGASIRMQHAAARLTLQKELPDLFEEDYALHGLVGAAIKVLTPHQMAAIVFGTPGFESIMLDIRGQAVILDEIHTYNDVSRSMVLEIVKVLLKLDCSIHIGTATMPSSLYQELLTILGGASNTYEVALSIQQLESYNRHTVHKIGSWEMALPIMQQAMARHEKVLLVCNTVKKAQKLYEELLEDFGQYENMLIHSRFRRKDRAEKERQLRDDFEGEKGAGYRPCWVVATQVVEVSLDISFDRMITACAPIDALIQRFGRINRRRTLDGLGKYKPVHVVAPTGSQLPYSNSIVEETFALLPDGDVLEEQSLQQLLDQVYPKLPDAVDISAHLVWKDGAFFISPLCNRSASVLQDALEISSATCILESDAELYEAGTSDERTELEIPVALNAIKWAAKSKGYLQSETGKRPFIVPQSLEEHLLHGLILHDYDTFL